MLSIYHTVRLSVTRRSRLVRWCQRQLKTDPPWVLFVFEGRLIEYVISYRSRRVNEKDPELSKQPKIVITEQTIVMGAANATITPAIFICSGVIIDCVSSISGFPEI